ncbi:MAG: alpha-glucosidase [Ruminococcaceae bacterium]|nr:alpha-glucosidase [Oscillospiraceae bacterium]
MADKWWKKAVVYEIYCKSFYDSDGDGIGDLQGVISKLPMLKDLGINCIWFAPIYTSPQVDNGYDVADYQNIEPAYGNLEIFKKLLDKAHAMGIRIIMDMVLNHSSDEHRWFQESRKSKDNPYRNYYIWKEPKEDGSEPNNWGNYFKEGNGSMWTFDETTGEYYFHQYSAKMPDLNWEYEPLRREVYKMLNWWIDFGVDGFRLDVISRLKKSPGFPDSTQQPDPVTDKGCFVADRRMCTDIPGIHDFLQELNEEVFGKRGCFTVGEGAGINPDNALMYIAPERKELDSVYHFDLSSRSRYTITPEHFRTVQKKWAAVIEQGGWAVQYLSNHDSARQVSCYGSDGEYRTRSAKLLGTLIHTTPGIPFIYQGEEIGMTNVYFDSIEDYDCCYTLGDYDALVKNGVSPEDALRTVAPRSRDNARTPYQWTGADNAGFTTGKPWMKLNSRYTEINLEKDRASDDSVFAYYQKLTAMRKEHVAIIDGNLQFYVESDPQLLIYTRHCEDETLLVIANYSGDKARLILPDVLKKGQWKRILSNTEDKPVMSDRDELSPWEVEVYQML